MESPISNLESEQPADTINGIELEEAGKEEGELENANTQSTESAGQALVDHVSCPDFKYISLIFT